MKSLGVAACGPTYFIIGLLLCRWRLRFGFELKLKLKLGLLACGLDDRIAAARRHRCAVQWRWSACARSRHTSRVALVHAQHPAGQDAGRTSTRSEQCTPGAQRSSSSERGCSQDTEKDVPCAVAFNAGVLVFLVVLILVRDAPARSCKHRQHVCISTSSSLDSPSCDQSTRAVCACANVNRRRSADAKGHAALAAARTQPCQYARLCSCSRTRSRTHVRTTCTNICTRSRSNRVLPGTLCCICIRARCCCDQACVQSCDQDSARHTHKCQGAQVLDQRARAAAWAARRRGSRSASRACRRARRRSAAAWRPRAPGCAPPRTRWPARASRSRRSSGRRRRRPAPRRRGGRAAAASCARGSAEWARPTRVVCVSG